MKKIYLLLSIMILSLTFGNFVYGSDYGNIKNKSHVIKNKIISKTKINKISNGKKYTEKIDILVSKISDSKLLKISGKLEKLSISTRKDSFKNNVFKYLESVILLEIYSRNLSVNTRLENVTGNTDIIINNEFIKITGLKESYNLGDIAVLDLDFKEISDETEVKFEAEFLGNKKKNESGSATVSELKRDFKDINLYILGIMKVKLFTLDGDLLVDFEINVIDGKEIDSKEETSGTTIDNEYIKITGLKNTYKNGETLNLNMNFKQLSDSIEVKLVGKFFINGSQVTKFDHSSIDTISELKGEFQDITLKDSGKFIVEIFSLDGELLVNFEINVTD